MGMIKDTKTGSRFPKKNSEIYLGIRHWALGNRDVCVSKGNPTL